MLSPELISRLTDIVGGDHVLDGTEDLLARADRAAEVDVVVEPENERQTAEVLQLASKEGVPVVPRGSGTGPSGGSTAREGQVVLSTARMNRILSISSDDLIAVVEPGVKLDDLHRAVEERGLFYPPDAAVDRAATLGGTIGESTSGLRALKYGGTRNYVMGMKIALPSGEILRTGATTLKCVTGYDLARLFTGSRGTLGVCVEIYLKLLPLPEARATTVAVFNRARDAAEASFNILEKGIGVSVLELMDRTTLRALAAQGRSPFPNDAGAVLLMETDGTAASAGTRAVEAAKVCRACGAVDMRKAETPRAADVLWKARRSAYPVLSKMKPATVLEEVRVPRSGVADLVGALMALVEIEGVSMAVFGHVGEGRIHPAISADMGDEQEIDRIERTLGKIAWELHSLGGRFGPERGMGLGGTSFARRNISSESPDLARRVKEAFDPKGIMNPQVQRVESR